MKGLQKFAALCTSVVLGVCGMGSVLAQPLTADAVVNANCNQEDGTETIDDKDTSVLMKFILGSEDVKNLPYVR